MSNKEIAKALTSRYSLPNRTFGLSKSKVGGNEWLFRRLITNIIVGGTLEENALKASEAIFEKYKDVDGLALSNLTTLKRILDANSVRFAERKADYIFQTATNIVHQHKGQVPDNRAALERFRGVGRHVASIVLALGFGQNHFAVDLHVKRIAKRLGLIGAKDSERVIEEKLTAGLEPEMWARYSRAFVDFGKEICAKNPDCANCFLKEQCGQEPVQQVITTETVQKGDGRYEIVAGSSATPYTVTVKQGQASCNCKGYRFRRTCSHVKAVQEA